MKITIRRVLYSMAVIAVIIGINSSCKKDDSSVNRTCKVAFVLNLTNAAADTSFINVVAGELAKNVPTPSRTGYRFDGWVTNSADANPDPTKNIAPPKFPPYDLTKNPVYMDMILYGRWIK